MQSTYKIYFDGEIAPDFELIAVQKRARAIFNLNEEKIALLFNGSTHILKNNLSADECKQHLNQLLNIGMVAKSEPTLINHINNTGNSMTKNQEQKQLTESPKKNVTKISALLLGLIVIGGGIYAWKEGYITLSLDKKSTISTAVASDVNNTNATNLTPDTQDLATISNGNIIEECTAPEVNQLLEKILAQGIPELIKRSSPEINLTISDYNQNQELYFDQMRNKRLCGVLAQFSVEAPNIMQNIENPSVVYEVIYEIQKEDDSAIRLSTFRQKIISSNVQTTVDNQ